jgi:hypothetical protein
MRYRADFVLRVGRHEHAALLIRWEKKAANYLAFVHLQFALTTLRAAMALG